MTPLTTRELEPKIQPNDLSQMEYQENITAVLKSYHKDHITTNKISISKETISQDEIQIDVT